MFQIFVKWLIKCNLYAIFSLHFTYLVLKGHPVGTKRDKFVVLAEKRVVRAIHDLRLIGNLSNRNNYEFSEKDVDKILNTLQQEIASLRSQFKSSTSRETIEFKLD